VLIEYCLAVPANRLGLAIFRDSQLKIIQEAVTIVVFNRFAIMFLKEKLGMELSRRVRFSCVAAFFAFAFKANRTAP